MTRRKIKKKKKKWRTQNNIFLINFELLYKLTIYYYVHNYVPAFSRVNKVFLVIFETLTLEIMNMISHASELAMMRQPRPQSNFGNNGVKTG